MLRLLTSILLTISAFAYVVFSSSHHYTFEVVVYGGTPAGIVSAVAASREGAEVALLIENEHLGGMMTSGLSHADKNISDVIGGISKEFFKRAGVKYEGDLAWSVEPHIAMQVFTEMLAEEKVQVFYHQPLQYVHKEGSSIKRIATADFHSFAADLFIDASYEGDLLAKSGVSYAVGRESKHGFHEHHAGNFEKDVYHQFPDGITPFDADGKMLPFVQEGNFGKVGTGDKRLQAYNFRFCWTDRKDNRVPFWKPENYDPRDYLLLAKLFDVAPTLKLSDIFFFVPLPNEKYDVNNRGPFSSDFIGMNWDYPEADYERRREIWQEHKQYTEGLLYFLITDPGIPPHVQNRIREFGHCKDEFQKYAYWPPQLYIREARRMRGDFVFSEHDLLKHTYKQDSIGMGSSGIETHYVRRYVNDDGWVKNEGFKRTHARIFEIPYRALLPKISEASNLIVPINVSSTEVGFSAVRMEPVYMILGHAAGVAASIGIKEHVGFHEVDLGKLQEKLVEQKQIIHPGR